MFSGSPLPPLLPAHAAAPERRSAPAIPRRCGRTTGRQKRWSWSWSWAGTSIICTWPCLAPKKSVPFHIAVDHGYTGLLVVPFEEFMHWPSMSAFILKQYNNYQNIIFTVKLRLELPWPNFDIPPNLTSLNGPTPPFHPSSPSKQCKSSYTSREICRMSSSGQFNK